MFNKEIDISASSNSEVFADSLFDKAYYVILIRDGNT